MIWAVIGGLMSGFVVGFLLCVTLTASKENEYIESLENKIKEFEDRQ